MAQSSFVVIHQVPATIYNCMFWMGLRPSRFPSRGGPGTPSKTMCVIWRHKCACQMATKSVKRLRQNVDNRQTTPRRNA